ncbi:hypothetical protein [Paraburkholderia sp. SIMBA_030]|uniref:hypothetical protein n=1 Tax=Paraburkholderia sp. SIMBA_030 TaxID=3085773 RepID=UPI00397D08E7
MGAKVLGVIRGLGTTYADGTERMEIHVKLGKAKPLPHAMNARIPVLLDITGTLYQGGVRATPNNLYVWICPDITTLFSERRKLAHTLTAAGFHKNDQVCLDVDGGSITVCAAN